VVELLTYLEWTISMVFVQPFDFFCCFCFNRVFFNIKTTYKYIKNGVVCLAPAGPSPLRRLRVPHAGGVGVRLEPRLHERRQAPPRLLGEAYGGGGGHSRCTLNGLELSKELSEGSFVKLGWSLQQSSVDTLLHAAASFFSVHSGTRTSPPPFNNTQE
jgi:hypothetical protein